jgi:hypothetical protein
LACFAWIRPSIHTKLRPVHGHAVVVVIAVETARPFDSLVVVVEVHGINTCSIPWGGGARLTSRRLRSAVV